MDWYAKITRPTLAVHEGRARKNIQGMARKAAESGVVFRPHFKTHQSAAVGRWFADEGAQAITVSSLKMARYFAGQGWRDITIAFPVNPRQLPELAELAGSVRLGLLFADPQTAASAARALRKAGSSADAWIKVDAGYGRSGVRWDDGDDVAALVRAVTEPSEAAGQHGTAAAGSPLSLAGLLTHAGQSYHMEDAEARRAEFHRVAERMDAARVVAESASGASPGLGLAISVGDTPGATAAGSFAGVDEVRPGNFVYFDAQQLHLGSCTEEEIAAAVVCPVVAVYPGRGEAVVHGGAIHLSAQAEEMLEGVTMFGYAVPLTADGWGPIDRRRRVVRISQEHGVIAGEEEFLRGLAPGSLIAVIPVHSCLAVDLADAALTTAGRMIDVEMR
jgi:D-serine deaminase-like pyridoxal phosphate-dependent protein